MISLKDILKKTFLEETAEINENINQESPCNIGHDKETISDEQFHEICLAFKNKFDIEKVIKMKEFDIEINGRNSVYKDIDTKFKILKLQENKESLENTHLCRQTSLYLRNQDNKDIYISHKIKENGSQKTGLILSSKKEENGSKMKDLSLRSKIQEVDSQKVLILNSKMQENGLQKSVLNLRSKMQENGSQNKVPSVSSKIQDTGSLEYDNNYDYNAGCMMYDSSMMDSLSVFSSDDKAGGTDDMNEMDMPNPGSIQHFQRLFYPAVPCRNCASCYHRFTTEIFGDEF